MAVKVALATYRLAHTKPMVRRAIEKGFDSSVE